MSIKEQNMMLELLLKGSTSKVQIPSTRKRAIVMRQKFYAVRKRYQKRLDIFEIIQEAEIRLLKLDLETPINMKEKNPNDLEACFIVIEKRNKRFEEELAPVLEFIRDVDGMLPSEKLETEAGEAPSLLTQPEAPISAETLAKLENISQQTALSLGFGKKRKPNEKPTEE